MTETNLFMTLNMLLSRPRVSDEHYHVRSTALRASGNNVAHIHDHVNIAPKNFAER